MDNSDFMAGLSETTKKLLTSIETTNSVGKRKADEISQNPYEDTNRELRELYMMRKKLRDNNDDPSKQDPQNTEKTLVSLSNHSDKKQGEVILNKENKDKKSPIGEIKTTKHNDVTNKPQAQALEEQKTVPPVKEQAPAKPKGPVLWINKLRCYPSDFLLENMITFRQILYEDLLKNSNPTNPTRTLQSAFMTTYGYSNQLLEPILQGGIKLVLADEWSDLKEPRIEKNYGGFPNFTLIRSPKDPSRKFTGAFHPKIWLLKFPNTLRVVVTSGNLTIGDWTVWSNCLWFRDFPKKSSMDKVPKKKEVPPNEFDFDGDFTETLKTFIQSLMPNKTSYKTLLEINIDDYYISDIDIVLIPSIPGRFTGSDLDRFGHRRVASVLQKIGFSAPAGSKPRNYALTYQTSSIGNLDEKFLKEVLTSFLPNYLTPEDLKAEKKPKGKKGAAANTNVVEELASQRVRMVFPATDYVMNSIEGPESSGCLILNSKTYERPSFPKEIFHQFQGTEDYAFHEGIIPHLKVFIVAEENGDIDDDTYIYFGSHNFSPSAWGRYEKDYTQLSISNSELGVLIPPGKGTKAQKINIIQSLPFRFPPEKYRSDQTPWIMEAHCGTEE